jgi:hypothetical protein
MHKFATAGDEKSNAELFAKPALTGPSKLDVGHLKQ